LAKKENSKKKKGKKEKTLEKTTLILGTGGKKKRPKDKKGGPIATKRGKTTSACYPNPTQGEGSKPKHNMLGRNASGSGKIENRDRQKSGCTPGEPGKKERGGKVVMLRVKKKKESRRPKSVDEHPKVGKARPPYEDLPAGGKIEGKKKGKNMKKGLKNNPPHEKTYEKKSGGEKQRTRSEKKKVTY